MKKKRVNLRMEKDAYKTSEKPAPKPAPKPEIERISNLIYKTQSGDIKIPKFQRGFIWKEEQILKLLESIYQGYPIGSLLFWLTETPMKSERNIGGFDLPSTPDKYPRNYVLDGQQRLTTIYGVLNWPRPTETHKFNVYFDLETLKFHCCTGDQNDTHVPMSILFDTSKLMSFREDIREEFDASTADQLLQRIEVLYETFREYKIAVVTIEEKTVEEVCPIFERINSTGTKLSIFDLMVAATWSSEFDLNDQVKNIRESTKLKDFEEINNSIFLKIMSSIHGSGLKKEGIFKLRDLESEKLIQLSKDAQNAIERAIDFLSTDLSVPSDAFLPYESQLIVFAYFFSKVKHTSHEQLSILRKWFWQTGFSEHFRGAADTVIQGDLAAIDNLIEGDTEALNIKVSLVENDLLKRQFRKGSAFCNTFAVMLANNSPRNITNGEKIDTQIALSVFNNKEFHHIFPKDFLKSLNIDSKKRNNICNICMLSASENKKVWTEPPSIYLKESIKSLGPEAKNVFDSNLIPITPETSWGRDDYNTFLEKRSYIILEEINKLCKKSL